MKIKSTIIKNHPLNRYKCPNSLMAAKRLSDNAEGLWRIYDKLYDLKDFIATHPGGPIWLSMTEGTDVTEAFETHHIKDTAEKLLPKFYVRDAAQPRNYNLTFHPDGLYKTLKRRVAEKLPLKNQDEIISTSKFYCDFIFASTVISVIYAARNYSLYSALFAAICLLTLTFICHDMLHKKDNWRMYLMNINLFSFRDWRVFHVLGHHMHPNSIYDLECTMYEPYINFFPEHKNFFQRFGSWIYLHILFACAFPYNILTVPTKIIHKYKFHWDDFISYIMPVVIYMFGNSGIIISIAKWLSIVALTSFINGFLNSGGSHHHEEIFKDGDELKSLDYGIYQLSATVDRYELQKNHFGNIVFFGQHVAHHFFPTLDHGLLPQVNEIIRETCKEFGVEFREYHWIRFYFGCYKTLARVEKQAVKN